MVSTWAYPSQHVGHENLQSETVIFEKQQLVSGHCKWMNRPAVWVKTFYEVAHSRWLTIPHRSNMYASVPTNIASPKWKKSLCCFKLFYLNYLKFKSVLALIQDERIIKRLCRFSFEKKWTEWFFNNTNIVERKVQEVTPNQEPLLNMCQRHEKYLGASELILIHGRFTTSILFFS